MIIKNYTKPTTIEHACTLLQENKLNVLMGGGAWLKLQGSKFNEVIHLEALGLNEISEDDNFVYIGSTSTLRQIETNDLVNKEFPILVKAIKTIMGINVRNIATIGGSIIGRYSFSDILPALLVMDVTLEFHRNGTVSLQEYLDNKKFPRDILLKIKIKKENYKAYYKTVKKTALDFSILNLAITKGEDLRIAIGSRPGIALRAFESEKLDNIDDILNGVIKEISVSSNPRSSKEYRDELLKVYVKRGLEEVFNNEN